MELIEVREIDCFTNRKIRMSMGKVGPKRKTTRMRKRESSRISTCRLALVANLEVA